MPKPSYVASPVVGGGAKDAQGPPPELTVEEALREEVKLLKQRIERMKSGHKLQLDRLYEENQMLIQDLLKAEGEIAAYRASGVALESKAGATPSDGSSSSRSTRPQGDDDSDVDPLIQIGGGSHEKMTLAMVPHDTALSSSVSSEKNLICANFSRNPRTAAILVVGGANRRLSVVQSESSAVLASIELSGPALCAEFQPPQSTEGEQTGDTVSDLVAAGSMGGALSLLRITSSFSSTTGEPNAASIELIQSIDLGGQASIGRGASRYIKFAKWNDCGTMLAVSLGRTVIVFYVVPLNSSTTTQNEASTSASDADESVKPGCLAELKRFYFKDSVEAIALLPAVDVEVEIEGGKTQKTLPSLVVAEQGNCFLHRVYIDRDTIHNDENIGWGTEWLNVNEKGDSHVSFNIMSIEPHPLFGQDEEGKATFPYLLLSNNKNRHFIVNADTKRIVRSFYGHAAGDYFQPISLYEFMQLPQCFPNTFATTTDFVSCCAPGGRLWESM